MKKPRAVGNHKKTENLHIRVTKLEKKRLEILAHMYADGNLSRLIITWLDRHRSFV